MLKKRIHSLLEKRKKSKDARRRENTSVTHATNFKCSTTTKRVKMRVEERIHQSRMQQTSNAQPQLKETSGAQGFTKRLMMLKLHK